MQFKAFFLILLGFVFLGLGAIGLLLPVWPTTPFVLVSVACFSTAPHIRAQILKIPFFADHIENYERKTGLPRKTFWISLIWLWGMLLLSMIITKNPYIVVFLSFIGIAVTIHILLISKSKRKRDKTK